jgi:hypothetical protein
MADSFDAFLDGIKLPERSVSLCLRGDLQDAYEDIQRRIDDLPSKWESGSLSDVNPRIALERQREEVRDEMAAHEKVFRFRALPRQQYAELLVRHQNDRGGLDPATWPIALIAACLFEPWTLSEDQVAQLPQRMSDIQFQQLYDTALACNREGVSVPFSRRPSAASPN